MNSTISRTPPVEIRNKLRSEVHFGCPVEGCGSPYLSWHHFDPPWNIHPHHNPEGTIALCLQHHKEADQGAFTIQQLRNMKKHPYLKEAGEFPKGRFNWRREKLLLLAGGTWYINTPVILRIRGKDIIWFSKDKDGFDQLNLDIYDSKGDVLLSMRDNDWLIHAPFDDMECPPSGNSLKLKVPSHDVWIDLRFSQVSRSELYERVKSLSRKAYEDTRERMRKTWPKDDWTQRILASMRFKEERARDMFESISEEIEEAIITLCTLEGHLVWPFGVLMHKTHTVLPGENVLAGSLVVNCGVAVEIA